jgi:hypothetical protein
MKRTHETDTARTMLVYSVKLFFGLSHNADDPTETHTKHWYWDTNIIQLNH